MFNKKNNKLWTVVGIIAFGVVIYVLAKHGSLIENILHQAGPWAPLAAILLYALLAITPITTDPITVIIGATYGPLIGVFIAWLGNNGAALVEYYVGKKIPYSGNPQASNPKLPFKLSKLPVNSWQFLIFGRMIPGYGGKIISILAGMHHVPLRRYLWTTALTNFGGSLILAYGGFGLIKLIKIP